MGTFVPEQLNKGGSRLFGQSAGLPDPMRDTFQKLEQAEALRQKGQFDRAGAICEALVGRYPNYFGALYTLSLIHI